MKQGEDCYDDLPRSPVSDVTVLLNKGPISVADIPRLQAEIDEITRTRDATDDEIEFIKELTASAFRCARQRSSSR